MIDSVYASKPVYYPSEFLSQYAQAFNAVIKEKILVVKTSQLCIRFPKFELSSGTIPIRLLSKLTRSFQSIKRKYKIAESHRAHIKLNFEETDEAFNIVIVGYNRVHPAKIVNLFPLILWHYIRYFSGVRPKESIYGRELTEQWKTENQYLQREVINASRKTLVTTTKEISCVFCGTLTFYENHWQFKYHKERRIIQMQTRVCMKHMHKIL